MEIVRKQDEKLHLGDTEDESEKPCFERGLQHVVRSLQVFSSFFAHNPAPIRTMSRAKALLYSPPFFHSNQADVAPFNAANSAANRTLTVLLLVLTNATSKKYSFVNRNTPTAIPQL